MITSILRTAGRGSVLPNSGGNGKEFSAAVSVSAKSITHLPKSATKILKRNGAMGKHFYSIVR